MNIQLIAIDKTSKPRQYKINVSIEGLQDQFMIKVESVNIANQEIQVTNGDDHFSQFFKFNQIIASDICKLVNQFHNQENIKLPVKIELEEYDSEDAVIKVNKLPIKT